MICRLLSMVVVGVLLAIPVVKAQDGNYEPSEGGEASEDGALLIPRLTGSIILDGMVDDSAWAGAARFGGIGHIPNFGGEPSERTEFLVGHDGEHLYFACRNYDSEPDRLRAPSLQRNEARPANDWCTVILDTYHDGETAVVFGTTPAGLRTDGAVANDAETQPNWDWNTYWDVAVAQSDQGWTAELRIPFHSLGFQVQDGHVTMGLTALRIIARKNEFITHPAISPQWGSFFKPSQMRPVRLEGVEARRAVHITPYLLAGSGHTHSLNGDASAWVRSVDRVQEMGLDVQYGLGANFTMDLTLNTDFAQVEADEQQVNLDRFSLFFPEQRRFFQERAGVFEFPLRDVERLFHSRRVGLTDEGEPTRIYAGARLVGRLGEWDLGLLNMQTAGSEVLPSENQGVVRARRRVLNASSYTGAILTSRLGTDGSHNIVYGADAILRLRERDYLTLNWAQSFDDGDALLAGESARVFDRALMRLRLERRGDRGLNYDLDLSRAGPAFEPRMGFLFRQNYARADAAVRYGWRPAGNARLLHYSVGFEGSVFRRNQDGSIETAIIQPTATLQTRRGHQLNASLAHRHEDLHHPFRLSGELVIPEGQYVFTEAEIRYQAPFSGLFRPIVTVAGGEYFDGQRVSVGIQPFWAPSRHFRLEGAYHLDRIDLSDRNQRFTAHVGRLRTLVMFSTAVSVSAFVQYNSAGDRVVANARFRYNPREGNDLWLVWNEGVNTNRLRNEPVLPWSDARTIMLKYTHTFSLRL